MVSQKICVPKVHIQESAENSFPQWEVSKKDGKELYNRYKDKAPEPNLLVDEKGNSAIDSSTVVTIPF